jgi:hypothetical protein
MKASFKLLLSVMVIVFLASANVWCGTKVPIKPGAAVQKKSTVKVNPALAKPAKIASKVTMVKIYPSSPKAGEEFEIRVYGTPMTGTCDLFYSKSKGNPWLSIGKAKSFPYIKKSYSFKYNKPGNYKLRVQGRSAFDCNCSGIVEVVVTVKPKLSTGSSFNMCPHGWKMKQINSETFTCVPKCPSNFKCPEGWVKECLDCGVRCNKVIAPPE